MLVTRPFVITQHYRSAAPSLGASTAAASSSNGAGPVSSPEQEPKEQFHWSFPPGENGSRAKGKNVAELPVAAIRRPLSRTRTNNQQKVQALMQSIEEIGLQEPIDVLEVEGKFYGFSGCHRYEAHQRLGRQNILCRIRKASPKTLRMHML